MRQHPTAAGVLAYVLTLALGACAACAMSGCATTVTEGRLQQTGDEQGCYCTYYPQSGTFRFEPFLKIADKKSLSEDGEPEVWGFRVWNLEDPDEKGLTRPVNILASRYVPADGRTYEVRAGTMTRRVRCPEGLWAGGGG